MNVDNFYSEQILGLIEEHFGLHISKAQQWHILFRLRQFMERHKFISFFFLYHALKKPRNRHLLEQLLDDLVVCESYFFRDPSLFEYIETDILEKLHIHHRTINIWSAACAHGQEIYSMAILCKNKNLLHRSRLFASDISHSAVEKAKRGKYPLHALTRSLSMKEIELYFTFKEDYWHVNTEIQTSVQFFTHNILHPIAKPSFYSLIIVRNVLLYIHPSRRSLIIERMKGALKKGGLLIYSNPDTQYYWA